MHEAPLDKKLVLVSATSTSVTGAKEAPKVRILNRISCICYLAQFRKDKGKDVLALLDSGSEVNAMTLAYAIYLGLKMRVTNIGLQKINKSSAAIYGIVIAAFQVVNKLGRSRFFEETFLPAVMSIEVILDMLLLILVMLTSNLLRKSSSKEPTLPKKLFKLSAESKSSIERNLLRRRWMRMLRLLWCISALCN